MTRNVTHHGVIIYPYQTRMIINYKHKGLALYSKTGSKSGIDPTHELRLSSLLSFMENARSPLDLLAFHCHALTGDLKGRYAVKVTGNWRLTFRFEREDICDVDLVDYH